MRSSRPRDVGVLVLAAALLWGGPSQADDPVVPLLNTADAEAPVGLGLTGLPDEAFDSAHLTLTLRSTFSPFRVVRYELKTRGRTYITVLTKQLVDDYGEFQGLALVADEDFFDTIGRIDACGLTDAAAVDSTYEPGHNAVIVDIGLGDYERRFGSTVQGSGPPGPLWCVAQTLIETYETFAEPVGFRDNFYDDGEYGDLIAQSQPSARVFVDGNDTGLTTPVYHLRMLPGVHLIRFVNEGLGIDRTYDATIVEGHTTRLNVALR